MKTSSLNYFYNLFVDSFEFKELKPSKNWTSEFTSCLEEASQKDFISGSELFKTIQDCFKTEFDSNSNHLATDLTNPNVKSSQLIAALIMSLIWEKEKGISPFVLTKENQCFFLSSNGEIIELDSKRKSALSESEKFVLFNDEETGQFDLKKLINHYFEEVCSKFIKQENFLSLSKAQSYMIESDPKNTKWLARRGLTFKQLGQYSLALSDLKRFLSFCPFKDAPEAVKSALVELEGLNALNSTHDFQMH